VRYGGHVDVQHLDQLLDRLHPVLDGDYSFLSHIAQLLHHQRLLVIEGKRIFIPELKTFVELCLYNYIRCDYWHGKDVSEVLCEVSGVDPLDVSARQLRDLAECVDVAFLPDYGNNADHDSLALCVLAQLEVECFDLLILSICLDLIEGTKTYV